MTSRNPPAPWPFAWVLPRLAFWRRDERRARVFEFTEGLCVSCVPPVPAHGELFCRECASRWGELKEFVRGM